MSAGAIRLVRDSIVASLQTLSGVNVSQHDGDFGLEDLKKYAKHSPHLVLAVLRFPAHIDGGSVVADVVFGLVALCEDRAATRRGDACLDLADRVTRTLIRAFAGYAATTVSAPSDWEAVNEYSAALDNLGVAMWGMTWAQSVDLDNPAAAGAVDLADPPAPVPLELVHVDYETHTRPEEDLGEVPEAQDDVDTT